MGSLVQYFSQFDWPSIAGKLSLVVAGPLVGALIAFLAVGRQLRHDRVKHERDRQMALRRDVYLGAAEALARVQDVLASFSNTSIGDLQRQSILQGNPGWMNKIHVVGSPETIASFIEVMEHFAETSLSLFKERSHIDWLNLQKDNLRSEIQGTLAHQEQLLTELRALAARQPEPGEVEHASQLVKWLDGLREQLDAARTAEATLANQVQALHRALTLKCMRAPIALQDHLTKVNLAIRKELELPLPAERYSETMKSSAFRLTKLFDRALEEFENPTPGPEVRSNPVTQSHN